VSNPPEYAKTHDGMNAPQEGNSKLEAQNHKRVVILAGRSVTDK
jgi:hypothetical protein